MPPPELRCIVLSAGYGHRLRPLTDERPKPLVPVGDGPPLEHAVKALAAGGWTRVVVNVHHLADRVLAALPVLSARHGVALEGVSERTILGTAGGVANAAEALGEGSVLIYNGDLVADVDLDALWRVQRDRGASATLAVAGDLPVGAGTVGLDRDGRVVRLRGATRGREARGSNFVGVHVLGPALRRDLPTEGCMVGDVYLPALTRGAVLWGAPVVRSWHDVGTLAGYLEANLAWLQGRGVKRHVAAGATVGAGVRLEMSLVGRGASVHGEGSLSRVVVWPGAHATAPLRDAVVTTAGRVVPVR